MPWNPDLSLNLHFSILPITRTKSRFFHLGQTLKFYSRFFRTTPFFSNQFWFSSVGGSKIRDSTVNSVLTNQKRFLFTFFDALHNVRVVITLKKKSRVKHIFLVATPYIYNKTWWHFVRLVIHSHCKSVTVGVSHSTVSSICFANSCF